MGESDEKEKEAEEQAAVARKLTEQLEQLVVETGEMIEKAWVLRREFFEKVIVLNGGTIALSVSLLSNLGARHSPQLIRLLATSWVLLITGMALGMSRNWFYQEERLASVHLYTEGMGRFLLDRIATALSELVRLRGYDEERLLELEVLKTPPDNTQAKRNQTRLRAALLWLERMCIVSTIGGYVFLVWFAIRNLVS